MANLSAGALMSRADEYLHDELPADLFVPYHEVQLAILRDTLI